MDVLRVSFRWATARWIELRCFCFGRMRSLRLYRIGFLFYHTEVWRSCHIGFVMFVHAEVDRYFLAGNTCPQPSDKKQTSPKLRLSSRTSVTHEVRSSIYLWLRLLRLLLLGLRMKTSKAKPNIRQSDWFHEPTLVYNTPNVFYSIVSIMWVIGISSPTPQPQQAPHSLWHSRCDLLSYCTNSLSKVG